MVLDALTKEEMQFLLPIKIGIGIPGGIRTGGQFEKVFMLVLVLYLAYSDYKRLIKNLYLLGA